MQTDSPQRKSLTELEEVSERGFLIKAWRKIYHAWNGPLNWGRIRERGKARFVVKVALANGVVGIVATGIINLVFYHDIIFSDFPFWFVLFSVFGLLWGNTVWSAQVGRLKKAGSENHNDEPRH